MRNNLLVFFLLISICSYKPSYAYYPAVKNSNGEIVSGDLFEPDEYYVTICKISLSKVDPGVPTESVSFDNSKSVIIFKSIDESGSRIQIKNGEFHSLNGIVTRPPNDSYSYAIMEMAPEIEIKAHAKFDQPMKLMSDLNISAQPAGTYFWSKQGEHWVNGKIYAPPVRIGYGSVWNKEDTGIVKLHINSLDTKSQTYSGNGNNEVGLVSGYLVGSNKSLGSGAGLESMGTVDRAIFVQKFNTPIVITQNSKIDVSFDVSASVAASHQLQNGTQAIWTFFPQLFNAKISSSQ